MVDLAPPPVKFYLNTTPEITSEGGMVYVGKITFPPSTTVATKPAGPDAKAQATPSEASGALSIVYNCHAFGPVQFIT